MLVGSWWLLIETIWSTETWKCQFVLDVPDFRA
jgi:hypothetical protein